MAVPPTMLSVDMKTSETVDVAGPLRGFIERQHADTHRVEDFEESLQLVQRLRDAAIAPERTEGSVDELWEYYAQLCLMESRFPVGEGLVLSFAWFDPFRQTRHTHPSLGFESASILFNIGALQMHLGAQQSRSTVDGIKAACGWFQQAAGVFSHLQETVVPRLHGVTSVELSSEALSMVINLCLAQAQECVYEKASGDGMSDAILAKVAESTADFYDTANAALTASSLANTFHKSWPNHCQLRSRVFHAQAAYHQGQLHLSKDEYGEELGRLNYALQLLAGTKKMVKGCPSDIVDQVQRLHARLVDRHREATNDNEKIYCEAIIPHASLPPIGGKALVKPKPIPTVTDIGARDLFERLVPFHVYTQLTVYSDRKETLVREQTAAMDEASDICNQTLSSLNLPAAIDALFAPTGVPAQLLQKAEQVRLDGGSATIDDLAATRDALAQADQQMLQDALEVLDREEAEDDAVRARFGTQWTRTPSRALTTVLREEASKYQGTLTQAHDADAKIARKLAPHAEYVAMLQLPEADLTAAIPVAGVSDLRSSPVVRALRTSLEQIPALLQEREQLKQQLREMRDADDITQRMVVDGASRPQDEIFAEELEKYAPLVDRVAANIAAQAAAMQSIEQQNADFVAARAPDNATQQRDALLSALEGAHRTFIEVTTNLREGIQFYNNLQDHLLTFSRKANDFVFSRTAEKTDMLRQIQASATGVVPAPSPTHSAYGNPAPSFGGAPAPAAQPPPPSYTPPPSYAPPPAQPYHQPPPSTTQYHQPPPSPYGYAQPPPGGAPPPGY